MIMLTWRNAIVMCAMKRCVARNSPSKNLTTNVPPTLRAWHATVAWDHRSSRCSSSKQSWSICTAPSAVTRSHAPGSMFFMHSFVARTSPSTTPPRCIGKRSVRNSGPPLRDTARHDHSEGEGWFLPIHCTNPPGASQRCRLDEGKGIAHDRKISLILKKAREITTPHACGGPPE